MTFLLLMVIELTCPVPQRSIKKIEVYSLPRTLLTRVALNANTIKEHSETKTCVVDGKEAARILSELGRSEDFDVNCEVNTRVLGVIYYENSNVEYIKRMKERFSSEKPIDRYPYKSKKK
jgi:hypothetical protein